MKITSALAVLIALCALAIFAPQAQAGSATANLDISVNVDAACNITTTAVSFPTYQPIGANLTSPDNSTSGSVTITCTPGATATIGLNGGSQPNGSQSRLFDGGTSYLNYVLYQDASRATPWTNSSPYLLTPPSAPDTSPRTYPVYGRIPAGQTGGGHYTDTVVATVNF